MKYFIHAVKFTSVSITGSACWLNCRFCRGRYLRHMTPLPRERVLEVLGELYEQGVRGVLVSGGFTRSGVLPVEEFIESLREAKRRYGFVFNIHPGLQRSREVLGRLREVVDVVDYEFTLSDYIAKYIRGLPFNTSVYSEVLELMVEEGLHVVPHLYLWHPGFTIEVFKKELKTVEDYGLEEATLLVYIPESKLVGEPPASILVENLREARRVFNGRLYLGCMRPHGVKRELDTVAVREGLVERVANPHPSLLNEDSELYDACCSIPGHLLENFRVKAARSHGNHSLKAESMGG
ncbi:MAG: radical SAM protein [Desulfurococcus sp.]|nr:radical SAM protein [Desulfurococcus sp.]